MKTKSIFTLCIVLFGMSSFIQADPFTNIYNKSKTGRKILPKAMETLKIVKIGGTIKWSDSKPSKLVIIATTETTVKDLSFIDLKGLTLYEMLAFVETEWYANAVNLVKMNKAKTFAKFFVKDKKNNQKHLVIMKLKKGVFTMILKSKSTYHLADVLGLTNTNTDDWETKSLTIDLNVTRDGTTIGGRGTTVINYKTKQDVVTKFKIQKTR